MGEEILKARRWSETIIGEQTNKKLTSERRVCEVPSLGDSLL